MKLTKATLKQLIAEVMKEEGEKMVTDLAPVKRYLDTGTINSTVEYQQLLQLVLGYEAPRGGIDKAMALKKAVGTTLGGNLARMFGAEGSTGPDVTPPTGVTGDEK